MIASGYYLHCYNCGKSFPEGCVRQLPFRALCPSCELDSEISIIKCELCFGRNDDCPRCKGTGLEE